MHKPPRQLPSVFQLVVKSHKTAVFLSASQTSKVAALKADTLSALTSDVNDDPNVPRPSHVDDFELCHAPRSGKARTAAPSAQFKVPTEFEVLDTDAVIKNVLVNWETLYIQFKDSDGESYTSIIQVLPVPTGILGVFLFFIVFVGHNTGQLLPVEVEVPSLLDEEPEDSKRSESVVSEEASSNAKGKRKAPPE
jgi:hypothetical protein